MHLTTREMGFMITVDTIVSSNVKISTRLSGTVMLPMPKIHCVINKETGDLARYSTELINELLPI